jgi:predicted acyltransferase
MLLGLLAITAFVVGVLTDVAWTCWTRAVAEGHRVRAANWSVVTYACAVTSTYLVCEKDWLCVLAFAAGCWIGTYGSMRQSVFAKTKRNLLHCRGPSFRLPPCGPNSSELPE